MRSQLLVLALVVAACALLFRAPHSSRDPIVLGESFKDVQARLGPGNSTATGWVRYDGAAVMVEDGVVSRLTGAEFTTGGRAVRGRDTRARVREVLGKPQMSSATEDYFERPDCNLSVLYDGQQRMKYVVIGRR